MITALAAIDRQDVALGLSAKAEFFFFVQYGTKIALFENVG
jgi:hypothetical protein